MGIRMTDGIDSAIKRIGASGKACCCLQRNLWMAAGLFFCPESQKIRVHGKSLVPC